MDQWSKTTSHQKRDSDTLQYGELRSYCGSRLVKFVLWIFIDFKDNLRDRRVIPQSSSSASSSSPTVSEIQIPEREDGINSDTSPVQLSTPVDNRSGQPDETQANKIQNPNKKRNTIERGNRWILRSRSGCKNSGKIWWMMKFQYMETLTPVLLMKLL